MSTTVDNRVLEMRFDNKQFESGVATTMSTLDKLKKKLNLSGASKGLETVGKATKGINFSGMTVGIDQVKSGMVSLSGISAGVIAKFTVINNMCNSLLRTGKRMVSALTIDPVHTGFQEYETQIGAIQTILSNTRQEGTNVEIVNRALDELNEYADKTIYNFTEMTRNIGTFTAAGVKLDTSVSAIKGIANLAAVSGSTSQQASTAMYQLSQALAAGKVSLMDWNSVVNAGMGGKLFQDALIRTSELLGTGAKQAIETEGSFRESLTKSGWLTTEVLTETLNQLSGAYSKADLMAQGFSEEQATEIEALAKDAEDAATKVKTFTQLWDVMKEAAQSGWAQTWRILVGDFEEAKSLFTPLADFFTGIIGKFSDTRNALLQSSFATNIRDTFESVDNSVNKLLEPVDNIKEAFADLGAIVDEVILGKFGNGQTRFDALTESGYNWMEVQNKVNEKLNNGFRYTEDQISAQNKLLGSQKKIIKSTENISEATEETEENTKKLTDAEKHRLQQIAHLSEAQMRANGYTEEQITAMRDLRKVADQLGIPIVELIANLDNLNGRWIAIESFKNIGQAILKVFSSLGGAWSDVFAPIQPESIFNAITAFHKFTETLILSDGNAEKLRSTFKGLFSILDLVTSIAGSGAKFAFKAISSILGAFNLNVLDITSSIGEAVYSFNEWITSENIIAKELDNFVSKLPGYANKLKTWFDAFKETPMIQSFLDAIENIKKAFSDFSIDEIDSDELARKLGENLANALKAIPKAAVQIGKDVIAGFQNGLEEGISEGIIGKIISFCNEFIASFANALGVHSPSILTYNIGKYVIAGLLLGLVAGFPKILDFLKEKGNDIISAFDYIGGQLIKGFKYISSLFIDESGNIKWDKIFAGGLLIGGLVAIKKFLDAFDNIANTVSGVSEIVERAKDSLKNFSKILTGYSWKLKAQAVKEISIAIAILSASFILIAKSTKDMKISEMWNVVGIIGALSLVVVGLAGAMELMSKSTITFKKGEGLNVEGLKASILQIGLTILALGFVVKLIGKMPVDEAKQGFIGLAAMTGGLIIFMASLGGISLFAKDIGSVGKTMFKLSLAMLLMVGVCKLVSGLSVTDMQNGALFAEGFAIFVLEISAASSLAGEHIKSLGGMLIKLSLAMMLMVGVCKLASKLSPDEMKSGALFAGAFAIFVGVLSKISNIGKDGQIAKLGGLLLSISAAMLLMMGVAKIGAKLNASELLALTGLGTGMLTFVGILVSITKIGKEEQIAKLTGMLISISFAVGILAGVSALLGMLDPVSMLQGLAAVSVLSVLMVAMMNAAKNSKDAKGSIIAMTVAIGAIALAVWGLSIMDWKDLLVASGSMVALMGMFALMASQMKNLNNVKMGPLIMLTSVVAAMAVVLYLLKGLEMESAMASVVGVILLLSGLIGALKVLEYIKDPGPRAMIGLTVLTAITFALGIVISKLKEVNPESVLPIAIGLTVLLAGLVGVLALCSTISSIVGPALIGALALGAFIVILSGVVWAVTKIASSAIAEMPSIASNLSDFITNLQPFFAGTSSIPDGLVGKMATLGAAMAAIGLGSAITAILSLVTNLLGTSFPELGSELGRFMTNMMPFFIGASMIPDGIVGKTAALGGAMVALGVGNALSAILNLVANIAGQDLPSLGSDLGAFMNSAIPFFTGLSILPDNAAAKATTLSAAIVALGVGNGLSAIVNLIANVVGQDLPGLGSDLGGFMTNAIPFLTGLSQVPDDITSKVNLLTDAIGSLSTENFWKNIKEFFTGGNESNLQALGTELAGLGDGLSQFSSSAVSFSAQSTSLDSLTTFIENIPEVDNDKFNSLSKFADKLKSTSEKLTDVQASSITTSVTAARPLISIIKELTGIDPSGVNNFKIVPLGKSIQGYSLSVSDIDIGAINNSISAMEKIKAFISSLSGFDSSGVSSFKTAISSLAKTDISSLTSAFSNSSSQLSNAGSSMIDSLTSGFSSNSSELTSAASSTVTTMLSSISGKGLMFRASGTTLMTHFINGIKAKANAVSSTVGSIASSAANAGNQYYSTFYLSGVHLVNGFVAGISGSIQHAANAAASMAAAASAAARNNLKIHSPSRVFQEIGSYVPKGFAIGIGEFGSLVKKSVNRMSDNAINGTRSAMLKMDSLLNGEINTQPTIRPVLDLSDIQSGVGSLNSMIGGNRMLNVMSDLNSIDNSISNRSQSSTDIIDAINSLGKKLSTNNGGSSYVINGITYDDGHNVANAVQTIVKAAKIGRRM